MVPFIFQKKFNNQLFHEPVIGTIPTPPTSC
jgi:hypothetical protein